MNLLTKIRKKSDCLVQLINIIKNPGFPSLLMVPLFCVLVWSSSEPGHRIAARAPTITPR